MTYKILYAEDEPFLSRIVSDNLVSKGYEVIQATDGEQALELFKSAKPDLCIIDIMMPVRDGYDLARDIRKTGINIPIIFLSARSLDEDVVRGFEIGGNDYLKKPFSVVELLARIESLLTRFNSVQQQEETQKWFEFGNCLLDTVNQQLVTPRQTFDLSYKESRLLEMLLRKKNNVLERKEALLTIWGNDSLYNANSMNVFITHLRKMLKEEDGLQIISIRGLGYKLIS
ncbi:response regulator transcription factor [Mucilaginibacter gilvus]|uniref:Response regulator transcription factor n=1 Tax=Mucilaginibacter gilvus TaxID=2305909 RepID=A0A3S3YW39_9SPHI|nr:response regulator transcription factor [Mucilaginibacter gilvus]RWY47358.1 response regulator transcription factor [Mucilaginibacter gilvus]